MQAQREEKAGAIQRREMLENEERLLQQREQQLESLQRVADQYRRQRLAYHAAQKGYRAASLECDRSAVLYAEKEKAFLDEQAGIIALQLAEGQPCPVCGSVEHPRPAELSACAPTEEQLKKAKALAESRKSAAEESSRKAGLLLGELEAMVRELKAKAAELLACDTLESAAVRCKNELEQAESDLLRLDVEIRREDDNLARRSELDRRLPEAERSFLEQESAVRSISESMLVNKARLSDIEARLGAYRERLGFESKAAAVAEQNRLLSARRTILDAYAAAEDRLREGENTLSQAVGRVRQLSEQLEGTLLPDADSLHSEKAELSSEKAALSRQERELNTRLSTNKSALDNIQKSEEKLCALEKRWSWLKALSNTANGNISGKEKIMLETYVQRSFFDRIIRRANSRFMVMSGGQYELKRRRTAENNRSQSGLELDVIDHYNGTERSVKTLSGGESFKASLSLALGLSDEIQSSAGGIRLDSMFVDEGFGSLDGESLQQAMKALGSLSESDRLVGIISHVAELKERIDRQIVVTKDKSGGSKAEIIV